MQNEERDVARKLLRDSSHGQNLSQLMGTCRLSVLDPLSPDEIVSLLKKLDLEVQARVLAHIDARRSFETLEALPQALRSRVLVRIQKLSPCADGELEALNKYLRSLLISISQRQSGG